MNIRLITSDLYSFFYSANPSLSESLFLFFYLRDTVMRKAYPDDLTDDEWAYFQRGNQTVGRKAKTLEKRDSQRNFVSIKDWLPTEASTPRFSSLEIRIHTVFKVEPTRCVRGFE